MAREHLSAYSSLVHHPEEQAMTEVVTADAGLLSFVRGPGEGSPLNVLGSPYVVKASAAETGDAFCCIECTIPPGAGVPPHTHTREHEAFYVLAGEIVVSSVERAPAHFPQREQGDGAHSCHLHTWRRHGSNVHRFQCRRSQ
jgi:mannose-6-phosphate isomerase-like protein (cupin superfamily)